MIYLLIFKPGYASETPERGDYLPIPITDECPEGLQEYLEYYCLPGDADLFRDPECHEPIAQIRSKKTGSGWKRTNCHTPQYYKIITADLFTQQP